MDDNKNNKRAIVLTIIAIATMVVVLVGATFAYLASVTTKKQTANVSATTEGGDSIFMISAGKDINVSVTVDNFGEENGSVYDYSAGKITLMGSSANRVNYSVNLYIGENDFEYSSGTCYEKPSAISASTEIEDKDTCDSESDYLWVEDACYPISSLTSNSTYTNSLLCSTNNKVWVTKEIAELVIDLYKSDNNKTCAVADSGVCVDNASGRSVVSSITTQSACTGTDKEWLSNINDNGICYSWVASKDITTLEESDDEDGIELYYDNTKTYVLVTKTNNEDSDYYYAKVTMRNLDHNQILNGKKTFNGKIVYLNKDAK